MADKKPMSDEDRKKGMLDALNKGIAEANGSMTDKEFVLIKRAKRLARMAKRTAAEVLPNVGKKAKGQVSDREQALLDAEK